jgi:hypothetical protein
MPNVRNIPEHRMVPTQFINVSQLYHVSHVKHDVNRQLLKTPIYPRVADQYQSQTLPTLHIIICVVGEVWVN